MDMGISDWELYQSPPLGSIGLKRRRNSRARTPPEAPPRKGPLRTGSVPHTELQQVNPLPTASDGTSGTRSPHDSAPRVEPASKTGLVSIPDQGGRLDYGRDDNDIAEGGRHGNAGSIVEASHVGSEVGLTSQVLSVPPSSDTAAGATTRVSTYLSHASHILIAF